MTSGQAVKYKSSIDCFQQVRRTEWAAGRVAYTLQGPAGSGEMEQQWCFLRGAGCNGQSSAEVGLMLALWVSAVYSYLVCLCSCW